MTEPGGQGLGVLLAESVQQGTRAVSRELLPLPLPFPENEHVESEYLRSLSRAARSRVVRRVGWQGWAKDGVRSTSEIYSKTSASEAGSRSSSLQPASLSRICSAYQGTSAAECRGSLQSALKFCAWIHRQWCETGHFQGGSRFPVQPCSKMADGADFLTGSDFEAWRDWRQVLLRSPSELQEAVALEGRVAPHTDPELKRKPRCCARLIRD